jgi:hypothetical protein
MIFPVAFLYFMCYPLIAYTLAKIAEVEGQSPEKGQKSSDEVEFEQTTPEFENVEISKLMRIPRFSLGLVSQVLVYGAVTFLQPTLALHLETFGYKAVFIGFSFAIPTLIYASTSPLIYVMTSRIRKPGVIFIGYLIIAIGKRLFLV